MLYSLKSMFDPVYFFLRKKLDQTNFKIILIKIK